MNAPKRHDRIDPELLRRARIWRIGQPEESMTWYDKVLSRICGF